MNNKNCIPTPANIIKKLIELIKKEFIISQNNISGTHIRPLTYYGSIDVAIKSEDDIAKDIFYSLKEKIINTYPDFDIDSLFIITERISGLPSVMKTCIVDNFPLDIWYDITLDKVGFGIIVAPVLIKK